MSSTKKGFLLPITLYFPSSSRFAMCSRSPVGIPIDLATFLFTQ